MSKDRNLLQYPVDVGDVVFICEANKNHGRIGKVLRKWDGFPIMGCSYEYLRGEDCYVIQSLGSPYLYEEPIEYTSIYYGIAQTYHLVVNKKHLKRIACAHDIDWKYWD